MHAWYYYQLSSILVPDPCLSGPCDPNASCEREGLMSDNFTCSCQPPFIAGDGFSCSSKQQFHVNNLKNNCGLLLLSS